MIGFFCDFCEEKIPNGKDRYLIKVTKASDKTVKPYSICLCEKCKKTFEEKIPLLFKGVVDGTF